MVIHIVTCIRLQPRTGPDPSNGRSMIQAVSIHRYRKQRLTQQPQPTTITTTINHSITTCSTHRLTMISNNASKGCNNTINYRSSHREGILAIWLVSMTVSSVSANNHAPPHSRSHLIWRCGAAVGRLLTRSNKNARGKVVALSQFPLNGRPSDKIITQIAAVWVASRATAPIWIRTFQLIRIIARLDLSLNSKTTAHSSWQQPVE